MDDGQETPPARGTVEVEIDETLLSQASAMDLDLGAPLSIECP
ncbi:MAG: hypothetical protein AAFY53_15030 [Pseudomonadota bacterium]